MSSNEYVPVKDILLDKDLYRALTKLKYRDPDSSLSSLINEMLKEYLHTYVLSKRMGHMLVARELVRNSIEDLSNEKIAETAEQNSIRYKEAAIIEHGKPSLSAYLELIRAFGKANKFEMEISRNPDNQTQVMIIQFKMGAKFAKYKAETYRILLEPFSSIERMEVTDTSIYIEYKPKETISVNETLKQNSSGIV